MRGKRGRAAVLLVALLLWSAQSQAIQRGESLSEALEELRRAGLQLIFSSALVQPSFVVSVEPGRGPAEDMARKILAPYGLTLDMIKPGLFAVVRSDTKPSADEKKARAVAPAAVTSDPLMEVDVYASRYAVDRQSPTTLAELTREDLAARPGLDQDALRVTQYLPGTASNALSARTHVRGGRDDEVAVYFDGVQLFEPFHFKDVQSFFGILDPAAIETVDFFSGVFPAHFGNRLSGVIDLQPREYSGRNTYELGASDLYANVLTQGRLDNRPIQWLAAVRQSTVGLLADASEHTDVEPNFLDALGRLQLDLGDHSSLALGWLLLDDHLRADLTSTGEHARIDYRDATGYVSWSLQPNSSFETHASAALTERHTYREGSLQREQNVQATLDDRRRFDTIALRVGGTWRASSDWRIEGGAELYDYNAHYDYVGAAQYDPIFAAALGRPNNISRDSHVAIDGEAYAGYLSVLTALSKKSDLDVGVRWDAQRYGKPFHDKQLSPRLSFQYRVDAATALRLGWGTLTQAQRPDELLVQDGETQFNETQRAHQTVASLERRIGDDALFRFEAYDKRISRPRPEYENVLDPFALIPELEIDRVRIAPDRSRAYGMELSARWDSHHHWSSWGAYSLSRAIDYFGDVAIPRTWEQKHSLNAGLAWTQNPWTHSASATWHTGWRRNALRIVSAEDPNAPVLALLPRNEGAWRNYFSLDLRSSWSHKLSRGVLESFVEVDNSTSSENLCCINYRLAQTDAGPRLDGDTSAWLPLFVLLGVTWRLP
jgi:hypothetical protein